MDLIAQVLNCLGNKSTTRQLLLLIVLFRVGPEVEVDDLVWQKGLELAEDEDRILAIHDDI